MVAFANYTANETGPESLLLQPSALRRGGRDGLFCGNNAINKWDYLGMWVERTYSMDADMWQRWTDGGLQLAEGEIWDSWGESSINYDTGGRTTYVQETLDAFNGLDGQGGLEQQLGTQLYATDNTAARQREQEEFIADSNATFVASLEAQGDFSMSRPTGMTFSSLLARNSLAREADGTADGKLPTLTQAQIDSVVTAWGKYVKIDERGNDLAKLKTLFAQSVLFRRDNGKPAMAIREAVATLLKYGEGNQISIAFGGTERNHAESSRGAVG